MLRMKNEILIVEDDRYIIRFMDMSMKEEEYTISVARTIREALTLFFANHPDLVILDLGLPDGDGIEVLKRIRENSDIPVIVVSARQEEDEKIRALDAGADDYVTKPFYMGELLARVRAALRRLENRVAEKDPKYEDGDLVVDFENRIVEAGGREIHLTPMEYKILALLILNRGKVLTHRYILKEIWGYAEGADAATLRVFMATLRRKIEKDPSNPQHILTEVGVGYRFK